MLRGDHRHVPGAVRASAGLGTSGQDIEALVAAVTDLAGGAPPPVPYQQDPSTGDYFPRHRPAWMAGCRHRARCRLLAGMNPAYRTRSRRPRSLEHGEPDRGRGR